MTATLQKKVWEWAIISRIIILIMQMLFNVILYDHDPGDVFRSPASDGGSSVLDWLCSYLFGGLGNWDGQYFLHIAKYGYTYENCLAFFPLLPSVLSIVANTLGRPVFCILSHHQGFIFIGMCVNFISFVISAQVLYQLGRHVVRDERVAYYAALLYCINPASIFFSAIYSESLFAMCTFLGMLLFEKHSYFFSSMCFAISCASRSNGIVACGFIGYKLLKEINYLRISLEKAKFYLVTQQALLYMLKRILFYFTNIFLILSPFVAHQLVAYRIFCLASDKDHEFPQQVKEYGVARGYHFPFDDPPEWCHNKLPLSYSHIQSQHWNVGFLKYYEWKQIPNFLLALPSVLCILVPARQYFNRNRNFCLHLGLKDYMNDKTLKNNSIMNSHCFPYFIQGVYFVIFGSLFIHIQVITRMLCSSCPVLYWFAATAMAYRDRPVIVDFNSNNPNYGVIVAQRIELSTSLNETGKNKVFDEMINLWKYPASRVFWIKLYFLSYFIIGSAMFANYYPFT